MLKKGGKVLFDAGGIYTDHLYLAENLKIGNWKAGSYTRPGKKYFVSDLKGDLHSHLLYLGIVKDIHTEKYSHSECDAGDYYLILSGKREYIVSGVYVIPLDKVSKFLEGEV